MKYGQLPNIYIKKRPKQARSKITFDALLQACADILVDKGYDAVTTNHVAERASVDISSLYEYFPNKETIISELVDRELLAFMKAATDQLSNTYRHSRHGQVEHMARWASSWLKQRQGLLCYLWLDVPFVRHLPIAESRVKISMKIVQHTLQADSRIRFKDSEMGSWLIPRMVFGTLLEISVMPPNDPQKERLMAEFIRLTYRILFAEEWPET